MAVCLRYALRILQVTRSGVGRSVSWLPVFYQLVGVKSIFSVKTYFVPCVVIVPDINQIPDGTPLLRQVFCEVLVNSVEPHSGRFPIPDELLDGGGMVTFALGDDDLPYWWAVGFWPLGWGGAGFGGWLGLVFG
jgi:hypothetical protein